MFGVGQGGMPYHQSGESSQRTSQFFATEGQAFVLCASQVITPEGAKKMKVDGQAIIDAPGGGFSAIFGFVLA
jgi:nitrilase